MTLDTAVKLIRGGVQKNNSVQYWADLGAGNGLFTRALSTLLPAGSFIYAIDHNAAALSEIQLENKKVKLKTDASDFQSSIFTLPFLDGILMANSLHYIEEQDVWLARIKKQLKPDGRLVIVEYDRKTPNAWVPFPVPYNHLVRMAAHSGFRNIEKLSEQPSSFEKIDIYAARLEH